MAEEQEEMIRVMRGGGQISLKVFSKILSAIHVKIKLKTDPTRSVKTGETYNMSSDLSDLEMDKSKAKKFLKKEGIDFDVRQTPNGGNEILFHSRDSNSMSQAIEKLRNAFDKDPAAFSKKGKTVRDDMKTSVQKQAEAIIKNQTQEAQQTVSQTFKRVNKGKSL